MGNKINSNHYVWILVIQISSLDLVHAEDTTNTKQGISLPEIFISSDSEGLKVSKFNASYLPIYNHGDSNSGIKLQHSNFNQQSWSTSANQLTFVSKSLDPIATQGYQIYLGVNQINGKSIITSDSQYSFELQTKTKVELILNRDRVETQKSLENDISYTMLALNVDHEISKNLTAVGMIGNMSFSDSNSRPFIRLKLIADVMPDYGINFQLRFRQYHSTDINVQRNYFNPEDYHEAMALIGFRQWIQGWVLTGSLGYGKQKIDNEKYTKTRQIDFSMTSPVNDRIFLRLRLGFNQSAGFQGPDYSYKYLMEELTFSF